MVGPAFAKEIFYTARQFDAEEARPWVSSTAWCRRPSWLPLCKSYADMIGDNAPLTLATTKFIVGEVVKDEFKARP